jgi:hypothetical protein
MIKEIIKFEGGRMFVDEGLKDVFGKKFYIAIDEFGNFAGLKYRITEKQARQEQKKKYGKIYPHIIPQTIFDCIDITVSTYKKLLKLGYVIPEYYLIEEWNSLYE